MQHRTARRLLASIGAAVAALGLTAPAAAEPTDSIGLFFPDLTVAADGPANGGTVHLRAGLPSASERPQRLEHLKLTVDFSAAAELLTVTQLKNPDLDELGIGDPLACATAGTVLTCTSDEPVYSHGPLELRPLSLMVKATAKAKVGDSAKLKFTAQFDGVRPVSYESTVQVGEGVDLAAGPTVRVSARPGGNAEVRPEVRNLGKLSAAGAVLVMLPSPAVPMAKRYRNCTYGEVVVCTFTQDLEPAKSYQLAQPLALSVPRDAAAPGSTGLIGVWLTPADFAALRQELPFDVGSPGTGGAVELTATPVKAARAPQTDVDPLNNAFGVEVAITGKNPADVAAIGASVIGSKGATVPLTVGVKNLGPATIDAGVFDNYTLVGVTLPRHTRTVEVDERCIPAGDEDEILGAAQYVCMPDPRLTAGASTTFRFKIRLDADIRNGAGAVRVNDDELITAVRADPNRANDVAKILVNPGTAAGDAGGADGPGGGGGGLPVTGSTTGALAGAGALLLAAGAAGFLVARRRRLRFTA